VNSSSFTARAGANDRCPSPLLEVYPGLLAKFECNNPGGSHKVRAARHIVQHAVANGDIIPGVTTVIEKTGGNFGFGLTVACAEINVPVELAVGLSFSPIKRRCLEMFGAKLIGIDMLQRGALPREVIEWHLAHAQELGKKYFYTDQFKNLSNVAAHETETGPEIAQQLRNWEQVKTLTFVSGAGTGASLTGITRALKRAGYEVRVILVEPAGCNSREGVFVDHRLEGIAVGVKPPFIDWELVSECASVTYERMSEVQRQFATTHGYFVGHTAAACLAVALSLRQTATAQHKVLSVIYDHGLWYT
jgi:cysteine synthase